ncbi:MULTISPECIES: hypothetical protein [Oceanobacillus]|uniref:Uncharacterized protein n=1 Tax=Oceanobacillus kimchii TaxID=746691 RepID=A0ABQ5TQB1_9BACI|nr:hypothetical protein [Oceanobacillus kimchii]GLO68417.1 hypothetical protein MACH08_42010 [Oceanobacillus kimchii]
MKKIEWLLAISLIIIGLTCLTVSGATMWGNGSIKSYVTTLIQICLWTGLPGIIIGVLYVIILIGRKNK